MTEQGNIRRQGGMRPRIFTVPMIATATLLAMMGVLTSTSVHSVNAQMMIGDHGSVGNMTSGLQQQMMGSMERSI